MNIFVHVFVSALMLGSSAWVTRIELKDRTLGPWEFRGFMVVIWGLCGVEIVAAAWPW